ncbi:hypothetical protein G6F62_011255 [Rhizopus arrhizus]|nr:hypothetical protein G6F16_003369 [Rhizopus arrhizus]KAG1320592.1 hypothetical protein G6F62_011255 [Rhizopus arrhizus]
MNTLIYSKLWHVLRLLSVPKAALQRFSSLAYQFVTQKAFPKFKYDLLLTDRQCGGLKLLDPNKQQLVLQWKWLCPLLLSHQSDSVSLQVQYLSYSLQHHFHAVDPLLPLLFPHCRKGPLGQNNNLNVFTNFFRTMDSFQRSYQDVNLSPASCLELPLASIYTFMAPHSTEPQPPSELDPAFARLSVPHWPKIQVSEAYSFDGRFHRKQRRDLHISRIHITRFFKCLDEHKIRLEQFFLSHCSPTLPSSSLSTLGTVDFSPILNGLLPPDLFSSTFRTTDLRKALSPCVPSPIFDPPISAKQWSRFWKGDVPLKSRDVWYRIIFNKLSCRQNLHRLLPTSFTDPLCPLCSSAIEDPLHFVLTCHYKHPLWEYIWDVYFDQPFSQRAVKLAIFSLQLPKTNYAHRSHPPFQLIACAILSLWSAHWAFVFSETPFDFSTVLANVFKHLSKLQSEVD